MEGCDRWRRPHPEQPLGGPDGWHLAVGMPHTRQQCTAAVASKVDHGSMPRGLPAAWSVVGGCYIKK
jgi:hypothetical protein